MANISNINNCASLESLVACKWVPLNKNPGLRSIGVGEMLKRTSEKAVMMISKQGVVNTAGSLQICAGLEAGPKPAIHATHLYSKMILHKLFY